VAREVRREIIGTYQVLSGGEDHTSGQGGIKGEGTIVRFSHESQNGQCRGLEKKQTERTTKRHA